MKLAQYLKDKALNHAEFARQIGVSQVAVSRYATGDRRPKPHIIKKIMEVTHGVVDANDFLEAKTERAA
jgi:predicted transcriptional regulator